MNGNICARDYITTWKAIYTWYISGIYCHLRWWYANFFPTFHRNLRTSKKIQLQLTPQSSLKRLGTFEGVLPRRRTEIHLQSAVPICAGYRLAIWSIKLFVAEKRWKHANMSKKRWITYLNVLLKKKHSEECGWMKCWSHAWKRYLKRLAFIETFWEFRKKTFHLFWWTFVRGARDFDISIWCWPQKWIARICCMC